MNFSRKQYAIQTFLLTALPCEAKPLISHYGLKKDLASQPFSVFLNQHICLLVTGLGKIAMAAGVAYVFARYGKSPAPIFINIGVAGHRESELGAAYIASKITDADTRKNYYPIQCFNFSCRKASILTSSIPQPDYEHDFLCDMEASAFFETACRFSTSELIQCFKVISDNRDHPIDKVDAGLVTSLITQQLPKIDELLGLLQAQAKSITPACQPDNKSYADNFHLSVSEQQRLTKLLKRRQILTGQTEFNGDPRLFRSGKEFLNRLEQEIDSLIPDFETDV